jgi:hypothetical protein
LRWVIHFEDDIHAIQRFYLKYVGYYYTSSKTFSGNYQRDFQKIKKKNGGFKTLQDVGGAVWMLLTVNIIQFNRKQQTVTVNA